MYSYVKASQHVNLDCAKATAHSPRNIRVPSRDSVDECLPHRLVRLAQRVGDIGTPVVCMSGGYF